jgi:CMP-N-acetylneuraminic acid synthetase
MNSLAFIPARGGSKRLPGKNIMNFGGKPLIYYSIAFAQYNKIPKIIVSTDDDEIASIAQFYGAEVLRRPIHLSGDDVSTASAAKHCLFDQHSKGIYPDIVVTLQPTNPLRPKELFSEAVKLWDNDCNSVISTTLNKKKYGTIEDGYFRPLNYSPGVRSQDLNVQCYENGLLYLTRPSLIEQGEIFGSKTRTILTDQLYSLVDIDTAFDFDLGEKLLRGYSQEFSYLN